MTEQDQLKRITARLRGLTFVESVSAELGYAAMRIAHPGGTQRVEVAKSGQQFNEWMRNLKANHEAGHCIYADYDNMP